MLTLVYFDYLVHLNIWLYDVSPLSFSSDCTSTTRMNLESEGTSIDMFGININADQHFICLVTSQYIRCSLESASCPAE